MAQLNLVDFKQRLKNHLPFHPNIVSEFKDGMNNSEDIFYDVW